MKKNNGLNSVLILLLAVALFAAAFFAYKCYKTPQNLQKTDTVIVTHTDTIRDTIESIKLKPIPKEIIKKDTIKIPADTTLISEQKYYQEQFILQKDTADVGVLMTGINSRVDSIGIRLRTFRTHTTTTVEVIKYVEKPKTFFDRFHFGLQVGAGYGIFNKKPDIYIGAGGTFDL